MTPSRRQIIVGHANTYHDPAIAILAGDRIFAEAIERHTQNKRAIEGGRLWYSWRAVRSALAGLGLWPVEDADVVTLSSWERDLFRTLLERFGLSEAGLLQAPAASPLGSMMIPALALEPIFEHQLAWCFNGHPPDIRPLPAAAPGVLPDRGIRWTSKAVSHHLAHAATAVYTSPFEECVVMILDGYGDTMPMSFFHFAEGRFEPLQADPAAGSLGSLYGTVTALCGFNIWEGEEWKVMGLAAYGRPRQEIYDFFAEHTTVEGLRFHSRLDEPAWARLEELAGGFRRPGDPDVLQAADLAHSFQRWFEDTVLALARAAGELGLSKNLAYAGGCALNSAANGKILGHTAFERLHVPSAPADDGNCLGVALYERHCVRGEERSPAVLSPYLGSEVDVAQLVRILGYGGIKYRELPDEEALCEEVAERLAAGDIVAWMQGRAEFGPRALGNRSILADPRPAGAKDRINHRVKFRESYRPLAPSILHEHGPEYFEGYQESPYMERTLPFREEVRGRVPAVVHEDGTGRLQTVREEWNPRFHRLIRAFHERTGVPLLLNTSFNVMGRPIVHSVEDALTVFFTTGLDALAIDRYLLTK